MDRQLQFAHRSRGRLISMIATPGTAQFIFRPRPWLKPADAGGHEAGDLKSRDGLTLHGYLTLPKGVEPRDLPAVLVVHGGPWLRIAGDMTRRRSSWPIAATRCSRSITAARAGFGKKFMNAGDKEWGGKMTDDMIDATEWLINQKIADPQAVRDIRRKLRRVCDAGGAGLPARGLCMRHGLCGRGESADVHEHDADVLGELARVSSTSGWAIRIPDVTFSAITFAGFLRG